MADRVGVNVVFNRELQYEYFYISYICLVTDYICTMFGSDIIPEAENIDTAYFRHTVTDKKYPQDFGVEFGFSSFLSITFWSKPLYTVYLKNTVQIP